MNHVLSLVQAARTAADPGLVLYSDHMLAELLALHDEMIMQLRLECQQIVGNADLLIGMIEQHEKTAAMLRAKLQCSLAKAAPCDGAIVITGEASSTEAKSLVTKSAQGERGRNLVRNQMTVKS